MPVRIVRLGSPRTAGEGLRIGTVRRPPRGVPKPEFASRDFYDTWLPLLSPSAELLKLAQAAVAANDDKAWADFTKRFRAEMKEPLAAQVLDLLAAMSPSSSFSVGCYCEEESRCHRSVLRALLAERGASIAG